MKSPKTIKEFKMPNTLVQGYTDNGSDPALAGLSGLDLITLVGCLSLVDPKNPGASVNIRFADLLDILQFNKSYSHKVYSHAVTPSSGRAEYLTSRFSPKDVTRLKDSIEQIFQVRCVSFRQDAETHKEEHAHVFDSYEYVYKRGNSVLDLDSFPLPPGLEKVNTCDTCPRPIYKFRDCLSKKVKPPTYFSFRLNSTLVEELKGNRKTKGSTKLSVKIFSLLARLGRERTTIKTLLLILRQTRKDGMFVRCDLKRILGALGFDSSHFSRSCTGLRTLLSRLVTERVVVTFNIDTENNRLEITQNKNWYKEVSL